jgi:hypothetical protein
VPSRHCFRPDAAFYTGGPNMVPNAIFDLLLWSPSRLKIFNSNCYLGPKPYDDTYRLGVSEASVAHAACLSFGVHDPTSQRVFLANLAQRTVVEADAALANILALTDADYLSRMDSHWGAGCW